MNGSHLCQHLELLLFFIFSHSDRYIYTVISCHSFNLHFPNGYDVGHLFMCLSALSVFSSVKCMFMSFLHSLVGFFFLLF